MPHKNREAIDEQQKQSGMTAEELTNRIFQITYDCANEIFESEDIEMGCDITDKHKAKAVILINQFKGDVFDDFVDWLEKNYPELEEPIEDIKVLLKDFLNAPEPE